MEPAGGGHLDQDEGEGGQDDVAGPVGPGAPEVGVEAGRLLADGEEDATAPPVVEPDAQVFEHRPQPEHGHGEEQEGEEGGDVVEQPVLAHRAGHPHGHADDHRHHGGGHHEAQGDGDGLAQQGGDRPAVVGGGAHVAGEQVAQPASEAFEQGLVEAQAGFEARHLLGATGLRQEEDSLFGDGVDGGHQQERHQRREEQDRDRYEQLACRVPEHCCRR